MRILKWIGIGIGALVGLFLVGALVVVWFVDPNQFKPRIETAVQAATGREFTLTGDIELGFFPWLALRTGEGRFGNATGFGPEPMVSWKKAQVGAKLLPLLRGELVADRVVLSGVEVRLIRHADGHANWENIGGEKQTEATDDSPTLRIDGVQIEDSHLVFIDEMVPRRVEITALALTTDDIEPGKPFTDTELSGVLHMQGFVAAGVPFKLAVPEVALPKDFSALEVEEFELQFGGLAVAGSVAGSLGDALTLGGLIETNSFDLRALSRSIGVAAPTTTDPKALTALAAKAKWSLDRGALSITNLSLTVDDTQFTGSFVRGAGETAVGTFNLRGGALDIARYLPPPDPNSEPFVLPTAQLKALKFQGVLELAQATLDDMVMKGVTLRLLLDERGLRTAPKAVATK